MLLFLKKGGEEVIAIDICNTIADVNLVLKQKHKIKIDRYPAKLPIEINWNEIFITAPPLYGAVDMVQQIIQFMPIVYITNRPEESRLVTLRWLKMHGFPEAQVVFAKDVNKKVHHAKKLNVIQAYEDDPRAIIAYEKAGIVTVVSDQPYNRHISATHRIIFPERSWDNEQISRC